MSGLQDNLEALVTGLRQLPPPTREEIREKLEGDIYNQYNQESEEENG